MSAPRTAASVTALPTGRPPCEACGGNGADVWLCPFCKQPLHIECGRGVQYHRADWPPQEVDGQPVIGSWHCTGCDTVAGLDVIGGDPSCV